ncbi:hypothetical protein VNO78_06978 [Psophocarpus tetragonolobus]|uniref:Uncharacterized protein n=1 Tax=Psophocarpus tetragonolobus TaxID=3891 RepID=A0AAN9SU62_PSOTE
MGWVFGTSGLIGGGCKGALVVGAAGCWAVRGHCGWQWCHNALKAVHDVAGARKSLLKNGAFMFNANLSRFMVAGINGLELVLLLAVELVSLVDSLISTSGIGIGPDIGEADSK